MEQTPELVHGRPSTARALHEAGLRPAANRIWRITYRSNYNGKLVRVVAKVPYSGLFALAETLTRAVATREIAWFRLGPLPVQLITPGLRRRLVRWPEALRASSAKTQVTWSV